MRAAVYEQIGASAEVLRVEEVERPEPGPGEVRVKIEYSGVNPTDWKSRSGLTARAIDGFQVPHHDGAGVIDAVGAGVDAGRVGQRVWTWLAAAGSKWGTAAQWSVVPEPPGGRAARGRLGRAGGEPGRPGDDRAPGACSPTGR